MNCEDIIHAGLEGSYMNKFVPDIGLFKGIIYCNETVFGFRMSGRHLMEKKNIVINVSDFFHEMILSWG